MGWLLYPVAVRLLDRRRSIFRELLGLSPSTERWKKLMVELEMVETKLDIINLLCGRNFRNGGSNGDS